MLEPSLPHFVNWLRGTPDKPYEFASSSNCLVAHYIQANWDPKKNEHPRFEGGNWSSIFPGKTYAERLRAYIAVSDVQKKMTHKLALKRLEDECAKWSF